MNIPKEHWFVRLLKGTFRIREIFKPEGLYLRRHYLSPRWSWLPRQVFLHNIRLSDDRVKHDHPWDFITIILKGCYREFVLCRCTEFGGSDNDWHEHVRLCPAGTILRNKAAHIHRVEIVEPVWSLVIASQPRRWWGFMTEVDPGWTRYRADGSVLKRLPEYKWVDAGTHLGEPNFQDEFPEDRLR